MQDKAAISSNFKVVKKAAETSGGGSGMDKVCCQIFKFISTFKYFYVSNFKFLVLQRGICP